MKKVMANGYFKIGLVVIIATIFSGCGGGGSSSASSQDCPDGSSYITHNGTNYCPVTSPYTGRVWLDRNLGASRVCTAMDDTQCYGDYYQWGRNADGHQDIKSPNTSTKATQINPVQDAVKGKFILSSSNPYDWTAPSLDDDGSLRSAYWSSTDGSSICPEGYRVPTIDELKAELFDPGSAQIHSTNEAFDSFLKLPVAGLRDDTLIGQGAQGRLWSSSVNGFESYYVIYIGSHAYPDNTYRSEGYPVRCIKD